MVTEPLSMQDFSFGICWTNTLWEVPGGCLFFFKVVMLNEISSGYYWTLRKGKFQHAALFPTSASRQFISHALLKIVFPSSFENLHWAWGSCVDFRLWLPKQKTIKIFGNKIFSAISALWTQIISWFLNNEKIIGVYEEKMHSKQAQPSKCSKLPVDEASSNSCFLPAELLLHVSHYPSRFLYIQNPRRPVFIFPFPQTPMNSSLPPGVKRLTLLPVSHDDYQRISMISTRLSLRISF